jgi:hypothetical protein
MSARLPLALAAVGWLATPAGAEPPARARASVAVKGDVWVGQRVNLAVELLTPGYFANAPAFDLPPVSGVVLLPPEGRPVVGSETVDGTTYTTQRHELAVYAQRAGRVEIPGFPVRFESSPAFGKPALEQRVTTPAVTFTAKMPPGAEGLSTVITTDELTVKETWEPQPGKGPARLGAAFTRTIVVEAHEVPGMVLPAFRFDPLDGIGVYPRPPVVEDRTGRGGLTGRRVETVTYVCERAGTFTLPALVLTWWDPAEGKLKRAELPEQTLAVTAAPPGPVVQSTPDPRGRWVRVIGSLAAVLAVGVVTWRFGPSAWDWWKQRRQAAAESESAYFAAFERACRSDDAQATQRALLAWLDRFLRDDPAPRAASLAVRSNDPELAAQLAALEDTVWGRRSSPGRAWSPSQLGPRVRAARSRLRRGTRAGYAGKGILPPLNPGA